MIVLGVVNPTKSWANKDLNPEFVDSLHVYLLTCSPHDEVYSLYGHTAIRVHDSLIPGYDYAINYGVFDYNKPFFILRFVFGLTDYEMGIYPTDIFKKEYEYYGSSVTEQEINLKHEEKIAFYNAFNKNYEPENRVYRYNYFYDNCTTRARDLIVNSIKGKVAFPDAAPKEGTTFREMIHEMNADYPWARLGNDLLLGIKADRQLTAEETEFLPHSMMTDADKATIISTNGTRRNLVSHKDMLVKGQTQNKRDEFTLTPVECAGIILGIVILLTGYEWWKKKYLWYIDAVMLLMQGVCGIIITAMIFSQHPTVSANIQLLVFNILPLIFGYKAIKDWYKGKKHWLWRTQSILICLMIVLYSLGIQWLDPSVIIVSCSLLLRSAIKERKIAASK